MLLACVGGRWRPGSPYSTRIALSPAVPQHGAIDRPLRFRAHQRSAADAPTGRGCGAQRKCELWRRCHERHVTFGSPCSREWHRRWDGDHGDQRQRLQVSLVRWTAPGEAVPPSGAGRAVLSGAARRAGADCALYDAVNASFELPTSAHPPGTASRQSRSLDINCWVRCILTSL